MNLLFDLDGTVTDSRRGIVTCFRHALDALGCESPSDCKLERFIGPPLRDSFFALLHDEARAERAVALYRERFAAKGVFENLVYPGILEALEKCRQSGAHLLLATAKPSVFAERILEYFDLRRLFHGVYGSELDGRNARKTDLLAHLLKEESILPADTVMIGDRADDVLAAKANGIFAVGVLWGFGSRDELSEAGADLLCETPENLVESFFDGEFRRWNS